MPINTISCSNCGTRINYVVDPSADSQTVRCPSCEAETRIASADLPERVRQTIADLEQSELSFADDAAMKATSDDEGALEAALTKAEQAFLQAKQEFASDDGDETTFSTDILSFADEYIPNTDFLETAPAPVQAAAAKASRVADRIDDITIEAAKCIADNPSYYRLFSQLAGEQKAEFIRSVFGTDGVDWDVLAHAIAERKAGRM